VKTGVQDCQLHIAVKRILELVLKESFS
jgi:hypothetical protein